MRSLRLKPQRGQVIVVSSMMAIGAR